LTGRHTVILLNVVSLSFVYILIVLVGNCGTGAALGRAAGLHGGEDGIVLVGGLGVADGFLGLQNGVRGEVLGESGGR
jgi:hypothetical protein